MRYFLLFARIYGIFRNFQNGLSYGIQQAKVKPALKSSAGLWC